jgi:hypothetical protein
VSREEGGRRRSQWAKVISEKREKTMDHWILDNLGGRGRGGLLKRHGGPTNIFI